MDWVARRWVHLLATFCEKKKSLQSAPNRYQLPNCRPAVAMTPSCWALVVFLVSIWAMTAAARRQKTCLKNSKSCWRSAFAYRHQHGGGQAFRFRRTCPRTCFWLVWRGVTLAHENRLLLIASAETKKIPIGFNGTAAATLTLVPTLRLWWAGDCWCDGDCQATWWSASAAARWVAGARGLSARPPVAATSSTAGAATAL